MAYVRAGTLRVLATGMTARLPQLPDVPTVAEQGFAGFETTQCYGPKAPSKMPAPMIAKLAQETQKAVRAEGMRRRLNDDTAFQSGGTPAECGVHHGRTEALTAGDRARTHKARLSARRK